MAPCVCLLFLMSGYLGGVHASRVTRNRARGEEDTPPRDIADSLAEYSSSGRDENLAPVDQKILDQSPEFTGETAYEALCSFWQDRVRSKQYNKAGCVSNCATLTVDCNTGDDDGIIEVSYYRSKLWFSSTTTKYAIYKKHRSVKGRFMMFKYFGGRMQNGMYTGGEPMMQGCLPWMRHADSWCEGPKWSKSEDGNVKVAPTDTAYWKMTYVWIRWDNSDGRFVLEEDVVSGSKEPDVSEVKRMKLDGLGDGVGTMGPNVPLWYTVGVRGWSQACLDNDKPKGTDMPVSEDKVCDIDMWKVFPGAGEIVMTRWHTTHYATRVKKRFG